MFGAVLGLPDDHHHQITLLVSSLYLTQPPKPKFHFKTLKINPFCKHVFVRVETVLTLDGVATNHIVEV